jgi:hypothetical protein
MGQLPIAAFSALHTSFTPLLVFSFCCCLLNPLLSFMQDCRSPLVVRLADTERQKQHKRQAKMPMFMPFPPAGYGAAAQVPV